MLVTVLGLDTTTSFTTAGVLRDGRVLAERTEALRRKDHARSLPALVDAVLVEAGVGVADLDLVAAAIGPGSFTGIRLGLGFAKGLSFARGIPLVGIGTLDGLAAAAGEPDLPLAACLDARKGEVYLAFYETGAPRVPSGEIEALSPTAAAERIARELAGGGVVVGDAAAGYPDDFGHLGDGIRILPFEAVHPRGGVIAELAERRSREVGSVASEAVGAVYIRPSAAEVARGATALTTPPGRS